MADEANDVASEITLDDFMADEQESTKAEPSPAKEAKAEEKPEAAKPDKEETTDTVEESKEGEAEEETEGDKKAEETETEKPKEETEKPPAPKSENRYRSLANENKELRRQVETLTAQTYQPATEEELTNEVNPETGENYNRLEAKFEAYQQQERLDKYNNQVFEAQANLSNEAYEVLNDFPNFNPDNEQFDSELATEAAELLDANLIRDDNIPEVGPDGKPTGKGIVVGSRVSPYKLYQTLAKASGISATKGQLKGQQATEKMLANADSSTNVAPIKKTEDPLMALWKSDD